MGAGGRSHLRSNTWEFGNNAILRTTNGGLSWNCVLRTSPKDKLAPFFYDSETAWVADVFDEATNMTLFRTRDGGRSWLRSELHQKLQHRGCLPGVS